MLLKTKGCSEADGFGLPIAIQKAIYLRVEALEFARNSK